MRYSLVYNKETERETLDAGAVDDPKLRTELKAKIAGIRSNAEKVKDGSGGAQIQHTLGVDLGDVKTGLSISLGGLAPQPLTVISSINHFVLLSF